MAAAQNCHRPIPKHLSNLKSPYDKIDYKFLGLVCVNAMLHLVRELHLQVRWQGGPDGGRRFDSLTTCGRSRLKKITKTFFVLLSLNLHCLLHL